MAVIGLSNKDTGIKGMRRRLIFMRLRKALMVASATFGGLLVFTHKGEDLLLSLFNIFVFSPVVGWSLLITAFALGVSSYLRGELFGGDDLSFELQAVEKMSSDIDSVQIAKLRAEIERVEQEVKSNQISTDQLSPEQQQSLVDTLKHQLEGAVADDIVRRIEQKYATQLIETAQAQPIRNAFSVAKQRLSKEIESLTRRNNLSLTIGATTTALAVGLLAYLVLGSTEQKFTNLPDLLAHFIPRVSIAAFIEVFSFFFLRLYRSGIQEIKYFQNELTNIDMRVVALESAFLKTPNALTERIAPELASTDRNLPPVSLSKKAGEDGQQVDPKSVIEILDKVGKLLGSGKS